MSYYAYPGYYFYLMAQAVPPPSGTYPGVCPPGYHWDGAKCVKGHGGGFHIGPPPPDYVGQTLAEAPAGGGPWYWAGQSPAYGAWPYQQNPGYGYAYDSSGQLHAWDPQSGRWLSARDGRGDARVPSMRGDPNAMRALSARGGSRGHR